MTAGTGRSPNTEDFSATSMTHQLHCLVSLVCSKLFIRMLTLAVYDDTNLLWHII
jgi:hypothetical protein